MEVSGQLHALAVLLPRNKPRYPLDRRLARPQSQSGRGGEEKNSQPLPGLEPPVIQLVAGRCTTELRDTRVYPKVSGLAAWNENCKL
jgi:hypothetical protein